MEVSKSPAGTDSGAPSMEVGKGPENGNRGWAMVMRRKAKAAKAVGISPQLAKTAKIFASSSELERKRKPEQSMADQIAALREMVLHSSTWVVGADEEETTAAIENTIDSDGPRDTNA
jgi:hypothetical protein